MTTKAKTFDLAALDTVAACNKPVEIEIENPNSHEKLGVFFSIVGKDSDAYRARIKAMANENMQRTALMSQRGKVDIPNIDKMEEKNTDALVAATVGWRNVFLDGVELPFSIENARAVYSRIFPVRDQVSEAINDLSRFMKG